MNLTAKQSYLGSSMPEYSLYLNGALVGFWSVYHQGSLPTFYVVLK
jgi:hypothetical protein